MKIKKILMIIIVISFIFSCTTRRVFYFNEIVPPTMRCTEAKQGISVPPPILRPEGKRRTVRPVSQYFYLAIPNAMDPSGRANDLQRSLADMLYTELFKSKRFNLLDRKALVNLDTEWLLTPLKDETIEKQEIWNRDKKRNEEEGEAKDSEQLEQLSRRKELAEATSELRKNIKNADGILLMYITSRVGTEKGGYFDIDFRIVSIKRSYQEEIVLFADSQKINYQNSSTKEIIYDRKDIDEITRKILIKFPNPHYDDTERARIMKCAPPIIVINKGTRHNLIKGLFGYVVTVDESVRNGNNEMEYHFSYLAEFVVTEVFEDTCTAFLLKPYSLKEDKIDEAFIWDVRSGDVVVFK